VTDEFAPASTVEALVYACRQGPKALEHPDNVRRIGQLSEGQLHEICDRIQRFRTDLKYEGAPAVRWSAQQTGTLFDKWIESNGRKV
jgi:hypothetical protein